MPSSVSKMSFALLAAASFLSLGSVTQAAPTSSSGIVTPTVSSVSTQTPFQGGSSSAAASSTGGVVTPTLSSVSTQTPFQGGSTSAAASSTGGVVTPTVSSISTQTPFQGGSTSAAGSAPSGIVTPTVSSISTQTPFQASTSSSAPQNTDLPAAGPGYWGTQYFEGGCGSSNSPYGGYDNKPLNGGQCYNLVTDKPWDSIALNKGDALQIQLFNRQNCDTSSGAQCAVFNHAMNNKCVTTLGSTSGNFFARSIRIIENGNVSLNSVCAVNP